MQSEFHTDVVPSAGVTYNRFIMLNRDWKTSTSILFLCLPDVENYGQYSKEADRAKVQEETDWVQLI